MRIDPLSWREDVVTVAVIGAVGAALLLVAFAAGCWLTKSKHRHVERLERRNSIRQSLHSVRSIGLASTNGPFSEINYKRRPNIYVIWFLLYYFLNVLNINLYNHSF